MTDNRSVAVFYDDLMLGHKPEVDMPFIASRVEKRVKSILQGLDFKWSYPEHPGRLTAIKELLDAQPIPGLIYKTGVSATYEQLARVHTSGYLDDILSLAGKPAWLDRDTTAVSPKSIEAATVAAGKPLQLWNASSKATPAVPSRWCGRLDITPSRFALAAFVFLITSP